MRYSKKKIFIACLLVFALLLSACGSAGSTGSQSAGEQSSGSNTEGETVLRYLGYGDEITYNVTMDAVARFEESHPGVSVEVEFAPTTTWGEFANKLASRVGTGEDVDIVGVAIEGTRLLVDKGLLAPLNEYMENDPEAQDLKDDIAPALLEGFTVDGQLYELPREWNSMVIVYNTKMFDEAGIPYPSADWTWEEFADIAQQLTTGEGEDKVWGFANYYGTIQTMPWLITNGASILDESMENSALNTPEAIEAMQFVNDLNFKYKCSPVLEAGTDVIQLFAAGRIAMIGGWQGLFPTFQQTGFKDYDVQVWPANKEDVSRTIVGMGGMGITASSPNKDLAWELLKELTSRETIQALADQGAAIPCRQSAGTSETFLSYAPNAEIMYEGAYTGTPMPASKNFPEVEQIFLRNFDTMMNSEMDVTAQMELLHEELQAAMDAAK